MREKTVTLAGMAADLREDRVAELRDQRQSFVESLKSEYESLADVPDEQQERFEQFNTDIESAKETASALEHYAEKCDGDGEFTLQELNMDQYAATMDTVNQIRDQHRREDSKVPKGALVTELLKRGVVEYPDYFDADPGAWPAVIARNIHYELDSIGPGADEGNEPSMRDKWETT